MTLQRPRRGQIWLQSHLALSGRSLGSTARRDRRAIEACGREDRSEPGRPRIRPSLETGTSRSGRRSPAWSPPWRRVRPVGRPLSPLPRGCSSDSRVGQCLLLGCRHRVGPYAMSPSAHVNPWSNRLLAKAGVEVDIEARLLPRHDGDGGRQAHGRAHAGVRRQRHPIGPGRYAYGKVTVHAGHHPPNTATSHRRDADVCRANGDRRATRDGARHTALPWAGGRREHAGDAAEEHSASRRWLLARRLLLTRGLLRDVALGATVRNVATR